MRWTRPLNFKQTTETLILASAGAWAFTALRIPVGAILGAMSFTALACLAGRPLDLPKPLRVLQLAVMGAGVGASASPEVLLSAWAWPLSIAILLATSLLTWFASAVLFRYLARTDRRTAFFATAPGALSLVMALADEKGADVPKVAIAQALRVSILVCFAPFALMPGHVAPPPLATPPMIAGPWAWVILTAMVLTGCLVARRLSWPAPFFLGAITGSALAHGLGLVTVTFPTAVTLPAAAGLGAVIGCRFAGVRLRELAACLPASGLVLLLMAVVAAPLGLWASHHLAVEPAAGLLAFAPGSTELMVAVALSLNAHPTLVAAHHLARMLSVLAILPLLSAHWETPKSGRD